MCVAIRSSAHQPEMKMKTEKTKKQKRRGLREATSRARYPHDV